MKIFGIMTLVISSVIGFAPGMAQAKELTLKNLDDLIFDPKNKIKTVEDVLAKLPASLRTNYVIMAQSKSIQEATPENPRIIMFGEDAGITIAFNGGGLAFGGHSLEVIEHHKDTATNDFAEYVFGGKVPAGTAVHKTNKYVTAIRNSSKCAGCHGGDDTRPNWEPYPVWPGAVPQSFLSTAEERKYLDNFVIDGSSHPRYKFLLRKENVAAMMDINIETSMASQYDSHVRAERTKRFLKIARRTPEFEKYQFGFIGALSACDNLEDYFPAEVTNRLNARGKRKDMIKEVTAEILRLAPLHGLFHDGSENAQVMGGLRWLLEGRGLSMAFWGTSLQSHHLMTTVPEVFYPPLIDSLSRAVGVKPPLVSIGHLFLTPQARTRFLTDEDLNKHGAFCRQLASASMKQFGE
jgi:hypothetical protein